MSATGGGKVWFTAAELAELRLPGLPGTKRKVNELASLQRWAERHDGRDQPLARRRAGRGGGMEYHWGVLPPAAKSALVSRGLIEAVDGGSAAAPQAQPAPKAAEPVRDTLWLWFDAQSDKVKAEASRRLEAVQRVEQLEDAGYTRTAAVAQAAASFGCSQATLWSWLALIDGVRADDRLPRLAPRRKGGGAEAEIHPEAWAYFLSDWLRPQKPTLASSYARLKDAAAVSGWGSLPSLKTFQRRIATDVDPRVVTMKRDGMDALRAMLPPQTRSVAELHALECVNVDGHRWDVFVRWPDGTVGRPIMVAIQDVYSRKILGWRIGATESAVLTRLAFADVFRRYGIPDRAYMDNGRAFASKWISGGAKSRFRFKVRPEEPLGILTALGIGIHWTLPYRGQSKPIERAFRDLCDAVAKHPAFAGAYTGNRPDAKPEDYGTRAVDLETFVAVVERGIAAHNAKEGRRTEAARGRFSFDQVFNESYARAAIRKAGPEQLRLALLAADQVRADRRTGAVRLYENTYWTPELTDVAGQSVVVRFDPDALQTEVHVYDAAGRFLVTAPIYEAAGFADAEAATRRALLERRHRKAAKAAEAALALLSADQVAALLPADAPEEPQPESKVVRPVRMRRSGVAAAAVEEAPSGGLIDRLAGTFLTETSDRPAHLRVVE